jgi:hypothetical protein
LSWQRRNAPHDSIIEILGLQEEMIHRRAGAADACLDYYHSTARGLRYAGSMAVLAASCWVLTDTVTSCDRWRRASDIYCEFSHPYAKILSVCAGDMARPSPADSPRTTLEFSCRLLSLAWISVTVPQSSDSCRAEVDALNPLAERLGSSVSGQLLLPAKYVYEFSAAIVHDWSEFGVTARISAAAKRILVRAAAIVQLAQTDRYHWRRILPGFMPVEPEWLCIGRIIYEALVRGSDSSEIITEGLTDLENLPMQIADVMPPPGSAHVLEPPTSGPYGDSGGVSSAGEDGADRP